MRCYALVLAILGATSVCTCVSCSGCPKPETHESSAETKADSTKSATQHTPTQRDQAGAAHSTEELWRRLEQLEEQLAQLEGRLERPRDAEATKALELARAQAKEGNYALAIVLLANGLSKAPNRTELYQEMVRVAKASESVDLLERARGVLASAVYAADPELVPKLLPYVGELETAERNTSVDFKQAELDLKQVEQQLENLKKQFASRWRDPAFLDAWSRNLDEWLTNWPDQAGGKELVEELNEWRLRLARYLTYATALRQAEWLVLQLEREAARQLPSQATVGRLGLMISTRLEPLLADPDLPDPVRGTAEKLQNRTEAAADKASFAISEYYFQRMKDRLDSARKAAESKFTKLPRCRCVICAAPDLTRAQARIEREGIDLPPQHPYPSMVPGPLTEILRSLRSEQELMQATLLPRITHPKVREKAVELFSQMGRTMRRYEQARLERYQRWALGQLAKALYRFASDGNWTNADADELAKNYSLWKIDPSYLPPEASAALTWLLEKAVYGEPGSETAAVYRAFFASARREPLEAF